MTYYCQDCGCRWWCEFKPTFCVRCSSRAIGLTPNPTLTGSPRAANDGG